MIKLAKNIFNFIKNKKYKRSYSQSGEDILLATLFNNVKSGFYIDVGACDPYFQSNTQYLYEKGWCGINIDANESSINKLNKKRTRDINICALINDEDKIFDYYLFKNPAYNGIFNNGKVPSQLVESKKVKSQTLTEILRINNVNEIEFLSIDVEGNELNVLKSLDFNLYKPKAILVESFNYEIDIDKSTTVSNYLYDNGYLYLSKTLTNTLYINKLYYKERFFDSTKI